MINCDNALTRSHALFALILSCKQQKERINRFNISVSQI